MTNQKKKYVKLPNQEQLNKLWENALKEEQRKTSKAESLINEGYRPFNEMFESLKLPDGSRARYLRQLKNQGWACQKVTWNGSSQNFIRPPLE